MEVQVPGSSFPLGSWWINHVTEVPKRGHHGGFWTQVTRPVPFPPQAVAQTQQWRHLLGTWSLVRRGLCRSGSWHRAPGRGMAARLGPRRQHLPLLKRRGVLLLKLTAVTLAVLLFCEFLVYYLVIFRCNWPEVKPPTGSDGGHGTPEPVLRAMFLADTHLLGALRGHWLDKLRR